MLPGVTGRGAAAGEGAETTRDVEDITGVPGPVLGRISASENDSTNMELTMKQRMSAVDRNVQRQASVHTILEEIEIQVCDALSFPSLFEENVSVQKSPKLLLGGGATRNVPDGGPEIFLDLTQACRTFIPQCIKYLWRMVRNNSEQQSIRTVSRWSRPIESSAHLEGLRITSGETVPATWKQFFISFNNRVASDEVNSSRKFEGSSRPA